MVLPWDSWTLQESVKSFKWNFESLRTRYDTRKGNVAVMRLWRRDEDEKIKTTMLHLMHAAFAFGGLLAPVIARPFLAEFHFNSTISNVGDETGCSLNEEMIRDFCY